MLFSNVTRIALLTTSKVEKLKKCNINLQLTNLVIKFVSQSCAKPSEQVAQGKKCYAIKIFNFRDNEDTTIK